MLKEKISYGSDLPINCAVVHIEDYPIHFHDDLEVVFVLDGSIVLKNGYYTYTMQKGDIFILNDREIHSYYRTEEENTVLLLQLDLSYFCKYYEILRNSFFVTDMKDAEDESLERLRDILARIQLAVLEPEPGYERRALEATHCLIDCLVSDFQYFAMEDGKFVNEPRAKGNKILTERLNRITDYLYENYNRRLTLGEIAEREHLSIYYLSHVIKESTGLSFQDLLNFIRVEESEKLLLGTKKKIGEISVESGFSAVRYYIKYFTKWFGMHPDAYRTAYTGHVHSRETPARFSPAPPERAESLLWSFINDVYDLGWRKKTRMLSVEVDPSAAAGAGCLTRAFYQSMLADPALEPALSGLSLLLSLNEPFLACGEDYIITAPAEAPRNGGAPDRFTLLLFNFGAPLPWDEFRGNRPALVAQTAEDLTGRTEFLVRFESVTGEFRLVRCQFTRDSILERYGRAVSATAPTDPRDEMARRLLEHPVPAVETVLAADCLSVTSFLNGFSAELILADRIPVCGERDEATGKTANQYNY